MSPLSFHMVDRDTRFIPGPRAGNYKRARDSTTAFYSTSASTET